MYDIEVERSYQTVAANSTLLPLLLLSLASQKHSPKTKEVFRDEYDYIVVGAGSAGSVVASRLSEIPCVSVLLLEAGKSPPLLTEVPGFCRSFLDTDVDWKYYTVPQKYVAAGYPNKTIFMPRGKMLGGSSSINGCQYVRGHPKDYDDWATGGAFGWSYNNVLPYFKKLEDYNDPQYVNNGYHGDGGPMTIELPNYTCEMKEAVFEAFKELNLDEVDSNGPTQTGFGGPRHNMRHGQRCGTAKAYLVPREDEPNLDIVTNAFVTKIHIENQRATGVQFEIGSRSFDVKACREVIVSAGVFNTPQLLMLSGIGPAEQLNDFGIPVVSDLPVGMNLQDHPLAAIPFELPKNMKSAEEKKSDQNALKDYINHRSGILAATTLVTLIGYMKDAYSEPDIGFSPFVMVFGESTAKGMKNIILPEIYEQVYEPYENKTVGACVVEYHQPETRGSVKLRSTNPRDPPIIDLQYLEHPMDLEHIVEGLKLCQRTITSYPMRIFGAKPFTTLFPGCEDFRFSEDQYFRCVAKFVTRTSFHPVGTAKMGDPRDDTTVVDPWLRVKNIDGLRVVDASVMPTIPSGNTNIPTIMLAEKASDIIKETIECRHEPKQQHSSEAKTFMEATDHVPQHDYWLYNVADQDTGMPDRAN